MVVLPSTALAYTARATVSGLLLSAYLIFACRREKPAVSSVLWGLGAGILVCALWIWPEHFEAYRKFCVIGDLAQVEATASPYDPVVCGWALTIAKLLGSAFIIAPAEELFFRSFLYRWIQGGESSGARIDQFDICAFLWTVVLFALEHNRWLAGAMAGAIYGILAIRKGLFSAIVAHIVTNLALGAYVILRGEWAFW